jgi:hypothetical protein
MTKEPWEMISQYWETISQPWEIAKEHWETSLSTRRRWIKGRDGALRCPRRVAAQSRVRDGKTNVSRRRSVLPDGDAAATYNWTCTPATAGATPLTGQSTAASFRFSGLTPGVSYTVTANAVGAAGPGNWSNPASLIAV